MSKKTKPKKEKNPEEMSQQKYEAWRKESGAKLFSVEDSKDPLPVIDEYINDHGVRVTKQDAGSGMILTSREYIARRARKFKTTVDKQDNELSKAERTIYYPGEIFSLFKKAKPEIEELWYFVYDAYKNTKEQKTDLEILKHASLNWLSKNKTKILKQKYFEDKFKHLFSGNQYPEQRAIKRIFIGKLLQIVISDNFPDIFSSPEKAEKLKNYGYKSLYVFYSTAF